MANEESRQQLLRIIGEFSAEKANGERRISDLKKRLVELQASYETTSSELEQSKRVREAAERNLRRSQTQLNRTSASLLKLETRTSELQDEISQVSTELFAIKNDGDIQRDEFISAMLKFNTEIRKFNEMSFRALKNGQPDISTEKFNNIDKGMDLRSEKDQKDLENEILFMDAEMHKLEEEYQKIFHDVNYISELEKTCSSLGEELQRRYICPKCQFNNMELSEGSFEAEVTPTSSTGPNRE